MKRYEEERRQANELEKLRDVARAAKKKKEVECSTSYLVTVVVKLKSKENREKRS